MRAVIGIFGFRRGVVALALGLAGLAGCGGSSSAGGAPGLASTARGATTAGGGASGGGASGGVASAGSGSATSTVQQGYGGTWDVSGVDSTGRAYAGTAVVAPTASGTYAVEELVTFAPRLPSGDELVWGFHATAVEESGGLRVVATLRRSHVFARVGAARREPWDGMPLYATGLLSAAGGAVGPVSLGTSMAASFDTSSGPGHRETWTRSATAAPVFPAAQARLLPANPPPTSSEQALLGTLFGAYDRLPVFAADFSRPEFQNGIHLAWWDSTGLDFYRRRGPGVVLVLDEVPDEIAVAEETRRAHAFSRKLHEKAKLFDDEMTGVCSDANGMVTAVDNSASPPARSFAQSPVLYTGTWAASQLFRWQATGEQEAFDNVVRASNGAAVCVDISPDKTQFGRAIDFLANAQPGQVGPPGGKYAWVAGAGPYASLMWMYGGNNDMLHGIDMAFMAAALTLPAGHPTRTLVGAQACSLLDHVKIAQSGDHEINLGFVAATITGDPARQAAYSKAMGFKNVLQKTYLRAGGSFIEWHGIADWSGHNLGALTHLCLGLLGGKSPSADEQSWRDASAAGLRAGFAMGGSFRHGIVATVAAGAGAPGASDTIASVLTEIPFPKATGDVDVDFTISEGWSYSPYPSDPWYNDWMKPGLPRIQGLVVEPYFYRPVDQSFWNRSPLAISGGPNKLEVPGMDYLLSYWYERAAGVLGPND